MLLDLQEINSHLRDRIYQNFEFLLISDSDGHYSNILSFTYLVILGLFLIELQNEIKNSNRRSKISNLLKDLAIFDSILKNQKIKTLLILVFITLLFVDSYTSSISDVASDFIKSTVGIALFLGITIASLIGSYLAVTNIQGILQQRRSVLSRYKKIFQIIQATLFSLSAFLLFDIIIQDKYYTTNLIAIMILGYGSSVIMSLFFCFKLFSWFKDNKSKFSNLIWFSSFFYFH